MIINVSAKQSIAEKKNIAINNSMLTEKKAILVETFSKNSWRKIIVNDMIVTIKQNAEKKQLQNKEPENYNKPFSDRTLRFH